MATKKEEFLQSVKARIDEINPGLYEKLEASSAETARINGIAESDRASFIASETLLHSVQALLGNEITVEDNSVFQSGRRLFVPSPDQSDFVDRIIESGYMRGAHIMEAFITKEDVIPGSMLKYENYDRLYITSNDLIGMVSVIAYSNESRSTDKEQDFLLKITEDEHIKQSTDLKGDWISDISNRLSSNWGINGAADFFNEFSQKKEAFERDAWVTQAKETLRKIEKDFPSENPEISYNNTASNIRTLAENVRILATDDSERLNKMPEFTLCNGTKLFITPMYMGEDSAPMVMGIYSTDNISRNDIDMTNLPDGTIFFPLESPEMTALIKASGGFSNVELNKQVAHDALVSSITSALETTNENDHTGLREKADQVGKQISKAVEKAKEKLDEKEIQGILDGIQVSTIGGHKLAFALENDTLKMKYEAPGKEFIPVDYEKGEAFTLIPDTERVEYFINMSDFERTVGDAKARIAGMFADDPKMTDMTMGVVRHTDKELAYFNFHKTKDENGKAILEITDVTDPEFPRNIGTTSLAKPNERGDLDWVYYGATEAVVGEPYQEEEKVNKALEKGSITVADKNGLPKTYKIERDESGKVIGLDSDKRKIRVEGLVAKEEAPDVAIVTKLRTAIINRKAIEQIRSHGLKGFVDAIEKRGHNATDELIIHSSKGTKTNVNITYNAELNKFELSIAYRDGKKDKDGNPVILTATQMLTKEQLLSSKTLAEKVSRIARNMTKTPDDVVVRKTIHLKDRLSKTFGLQAKIMAGDAKRLFEQIKETNKEITRLAKETRKEEKNWDKYVKFAKKNGINHELMKDSHDATIRHLAECTQTMIEKNQMAIREAESKAKG